MLDASRCPSWVKSGPDGPEAPLPNYPEERTSSHRRYCAASITSFAVLASSPATSPDPIRFALAPGWLQLNACHTHVAAIQCRICDPLPQLLIMAQGATNFQSKVAGVRINQTWRDSTISTMTMNDRHIVLTHFPCLLNDFFSTSVCTISEGWQPWRSILITLIMPVFTLGNRNARRPGTSANFTNSRLLMQLGIEPQLATF
jgi:hypothetical protein